MELLRLMMSDKISFASAISVSNSCRIKPFFISFSAAIKAQLSALAFSAFFSTALKGFDFVQPSAFQHKNFL